jgi:class 3 adenylate cyclase
VHRAARICSVANGGQVLVSDTTRALLEDDEAEIENLVIRDAGSYTLSGFPSSVQLWEVVSAEQAGRPPAAPRERRRT